MKGEFIFAFLYHNRLRILYCLWLNDLYRWVCHCSNLLIIASVNCSLECQNLLLVLLWTFLRKMDSFCGYLHFYRCTFQIHSLANFLLIRHIRCNLGIVGIEYIFTTLFSIFWYKMETNDYFRLVINPVSIIISNLLLFLFFNATLIDPPLK